MSVSTLSAETDAISRLQLAKALKEDPGNRGAEPPENSAIFNRQRSRQPPLRGAFFIPRPMNLLIPPILGNSEEYYKDNNIAPPSSQPNVLSFQQQQQQMIQQDRRPSQPQVYSQSPRNSIIIPEERRGSASRPATLLDVRQSMLNARHNIQNSVPFTTSSSQKTSIITQQNKSLLVENNGKPSRLSIVTNSRPNSVISSSRPVSSYSSNTNHKSNKSLNSDENEDEENKSHKSKDIKKKESSSSVGSDTKPPLLPPIKSVTNQSIVLEKVEEEDSSDSEEEEEDEEDDDDSSEDDTPLALKSTPKIKVAPPRITTRKGSNGGARIEAWLEHVSGTPEGSPSRSSTPTHSPRPSTPTHSPRPSTPHSPRSSTPNHSPRSSTPNYSPTHPHSPRVRKTSEHSIYNSSPLSPHRLSYVAEPTYDARNRRPKSAFFSDNLQAPKPDFHQPRKRSNSEFVPKIRPNSIFYDQVPQVPPYPGRVSPSPRQDSGYWAKDTLITLSDDLRHISLMNDSSSSSHSSGSRNRSSSVGNISSNNAKLTPINNNVTKVMNRHRREGSGSSLHSNKSSNPQLHVPSQGGYLSQIPATQSPRSKDSLHAPPAMNGNRNSLYMSSNGISQRYSAEQLKANRNSTYSTHSHQQQKHRIKS